MRIIKKQLRMHKLPKAKCEHDMDLWHFKSILYEFLELLNLSLSVRRRDVVLASL